MRPPFRSSGRGSGPRASACSARWRETDEELATLETHPAGALSEDVATDTATTILSRLEGQERHELDELDAAQARLESGAFGVCQRCGKAIPLARLRAVPITRYCLACEAARETAR